MKLTVNLHEKLIQYNEAKFDIQDDLILKEANQILENSHKEDLDILSKIGLNKNLTKADAITKKRATESNFKEVYDISAIEKLAINYGLRFLPSEMYVGTIDPLLPTKIKQFVSEHNIDMNKKPELYTRRSNSVFYILAPKASFELEEFPKDPIIFYKINEEKYAFVHKWGNDLTFSRYISNLPMRNLGAFALAYIIFLSAIILTGFYLSGSPEWFIGYVVSMGFIGVAVEGRYNDSKWDRVFRD